MPASSHAFINDTQEKIIKAACQHFDITEEQLMKNQSHVFAYMRHICFSLIKKNTILNERFIGIRFNRTRNPVYTGIANIDCQKNIYRQTLDDLKKIAEKAGNLKF